MERLCSYEYKYVYYVDEYNYEKVLKRRIPFDGVSVYEVKATYAKQVPVTTYYVLGRTEREARNRFSGTLVWMKIKAIRKMRKEEAESVLTDRFKILL